MAFDRRKFKVLLGWFCALIRSLAECVRSGYHRIAHKTAGRSEKLQPTAPTASGAKSRSRNQSFSHFLYVHLIRQIEAALGRIETFLVVLLLSLMILFSFGQVILRNFFNHGIPWADLLVRQLVLWVGFLGASLAVRESKHISIDALSHFLSVPWKKFVQTLVYLATGTISGFLAWAAWRFVQFEMESESTLFLDLPVWIFQTILPYSLCVISVRFLFKALDVLLTGDDSKK